MTLTPVLQVPNSAILACENYTDLTGKDFADARKDKTVRAVLVKNAYH